MAIVNGTTMTIEQAIQFVGTRVKVFSMFDEIENVYIVTTL